MWGHPTRQTPQGVALAPLQSCSGLEGPTFLWHHAWLELQHATCQSVCTQIRPKKAHQVPTSWPQETATFPLPSSTNPLRDQGATSCSIRQDRPTFPRKKQTRQRHYCYLHMVWPRMWSNIESFPKRDCIPPIKRHWAVLAASRQLLDYLATRPDTAIRYHASDIILEFDTDASYLSEPGGKSFAAAYYYMTKKGHIEFNNGAISVLSTIIKHVMSSVYEAETDALYYGCKRSIPYRVTLQEMGHP